MEQAGGDRSQSPRRAIFVNRYFFPDVSATSQILFDLCQQLAARGIKVEVVCSRQLYEDPKARLARFEDIDGIKVHRVATSRFGRGRLVGRGLDYASFYASAFIKLLTLIQENDVVVAKTDPPLISVVAAMAAQLRGARIINWLQDVFPEVAVVLGVNPLPRALTRLLKGLRDQSLQSAIMNVVLGNRMQAHLRGLGIPAERICIIENWADTIPSRPVAGSRLRAELELMDRFVVGYSGNLGRAHDYETLLAAARRLKTRTDIVFLMVGGGVGMKALAGAVDAEGLPNFRFLGYRPRALLADSLAAADVHLACLRPALEGLIVPSKCYGILAAARPLLFIGDPAGEWPEIIREFQCGAVIAEGDAEGLAAKLRELSAVPGEVREAGARARQLFEARYTKNRAANVWINLLKPYI